MVTTPICMYCIKEQKKTPKKICSNGNNAKIWQHNVLNVGCKSSTWEDYLTSLSIEFVKVTISSAVTLSAASKIVSEERIFCCKMASQNTPWSIGHADHFIKWCPENLDCCGYFREFLTLWEAISLMKLTSSSTIV